MYVQQNSLIFGGFCLTKVCNKTGISEARPSWKRKILVSSSWSGFTRGGGPTAGPGPAGESALECTHPSSFLLRPPPPPPTPSDPSVWQNYYYLDELNQ